MNTEPESPEDASAESSPTAPSGESVDAATGRTDLVTGAYDQTQQGRKLAVRALLAGGCLQQRVAELLHTHRRSVGRMAAADMTAVLGDVDVVDQARTCLADTAIRGSTAEEREAAEAWLVHALRDEPEGERFHQRTPSRRPTAQARAAAVKRKSGGPVKRPAVSSAPPGDTYQTVGAHDLISQRQAIPGPPPAVFARDQMDALTRQQQRILHRSTLIDYVLAAEKQTLTLGDALAKLLADITEAARTIGTILAAANRRTSD